MRDSVQIEHRQHKSIQSDKLTVTASHTIKVYLMCLDKFFWRNRMTEEYKIKILMAAYARGIPMDRVYRILLRGK